MAFTLEPRTGFTVEKGELVTWRSRSGTASQVIVVRVQEEQNTVICNPIETNPARTSVWREGPIPSQPSDSAAPYSRTLNVRIIDESDNQPVTAQFKDGNELKQTRIKASRVLFVEPEIGSHVCCLRPEPDAILYGVIEGLVDDGSVVNIAVDNTAMRVQLPLDGSATCVAVTSMVVKPETPITLYHSGKLDRAVVRRKLGNNLYEIVRVEHSDTVKCRLNEAYYGLRFFRTLEDMEAHRQDYLRQLTVDYQLVEDAITGIMLNTAEQLIEIDLVSTHIQGSRQPPNIQRACMAELRTVRALADRIMCDARDEVCLGREFGRRLTQPFLLRSIAGSGKTWMMRQLTYYLARDATHVCAFAPLTIFVQDLAQLVRSGRVRIAPSFLKEYIQETRNGSERDILLQLLELKSLCIIFDGLDEASNLRTDLENVILTVIVPLRMQVIVTSRPEGVDLSRSEYQRHYVVYELAPLDSENREILISQHLRDNELFDKLLQFSELRRMHDAKYEEVFTEAQRAKIEAISGPTKKPQQVSFHGGSLRRHEQVSSRYLSKIQGAFLGSGAIERLDDVLADVDTYRADKEGAKGRLKQIALELVEPTRLVFERLGEHLLTAREGETPSKQRASELWPEICRCTDELFALAESCHGRCSRWFQDHAFGAKVEIAEYLKDPVRVYVKAQNDYNGDMSCVTDVIRARILFYDAGGLCVFFDSCDGVDLARIKNKFANLDAGHFRNVLTNLSFCSDDGVTHIVELQLHHKDIFDLNEMKHGHDLYEFLRARLDLKAQTKEDFKSQLAAVLDTFEDICQVPVLLSLLVVILKHGPRHRQLPLPQSRLELYQKAMDFALREKLTPPLEKNCLWSMFQTVACANMMVKEGAALAVRRVFTLADVRRALRVTDFFSSWLQLTQAASFPLVKTLQIATDDDTKTEFQFRHLSFQEGFFALRLSSCNTLLGEFWKASETLNAENYANTIFLGGGSLFRRLVDLTGNSWILSGLTNQGWGSLGVLLESDGSLMRLLDVSNSTMTDTSGLARTGTIGILRNLSQLTHLNIAHCTGLRGSLESLRSLTSLTHLHVVNCPAVGLHEDASNVPKGGTLESLSSLAQLTCLRFAFSPAIGGDLKPLGGLLALDTLILDCCGRTTVVPYAHQKVNEGLDRSLPPRMAGTLEPVRSLTRLTTLKLISTVDVQGDLRPLGELLLLTTLDLSSCNNLTGDIGPLRNLVQLTELNLTWCKSLTGDIASLGRLTNLSKLMLTSCFSLTGDPKMLCFLRQLTHLDLLGCEGLFGDIGYLRRLTGLKYLNLERCDNLYGSILWLENISELAELRLGDAINLNGIREFKESNPTCRVHWMMKEPVAFLQYLPLLGGLLPPHCLTGGLGAKVGLLASLAYSVREGHKRIVLLSNYIDAPYDLYDFTYNARCKLSDFTFWTFGPNRLICLERLTEYILSCSARDGMTHRFLMGMEHELARPTLELCSCTNFTGDIRSLGSLSQLTILNLSWCKNMTGDIESLSRLSDLKILELTNCFHLTGDLRALGCLTRLRYLSLLACEQLTGDIMTLSGLYNLLYLNVERCDNLEGDISCLSNLPDLEELHLGDAKKLTGSDRFKQLKPYCQFSCMRQKAEILKLRLFGHPRENNGIPIASPDLCDLPRFYELEDKAHNFLWFNVLSRDLEPVSKLSHLLELEIAWHPWLTADLKPLSRLVLLRKLSVFYCPGLTGELYPLHVLDRLTYLNLLGCEQLTGDLVPLSSLTRLAYLNLERCESLKGGLDPLNGLAYLKELHLGDRTALSGVDKFKRRHSECRVVHSRHPSHEKKLRLYGDTAPMCQVLYLMSTSELRRFPQSLPSSIEPRDDIYEFRWYHCDLEPLRGLSRLTQLHIHFSESLRGNLKPLSGLTQLCALTVSYCSNLTGDLQPLSGLLQLNALELYRCQQLSGDVMPLGGLTRLTKLNLEKCDGIRGNVHWAFRKLTQLRQLGCCHMLLGIGQFKRNHPYCKITSSAK